MLEMKPNCETCDGALANDGEAHICSFECTFCDSCTTDTHKHTCPNCGGELVRRPKRKAK